MRLPKKRRRCLTAGLGCAGILVVGCLITAYLLVNPFFLRTPEHQFLDALLNGDEETAQAYLSPNLRRFVEEHCENGQVTRCLDGVIPEEWGEFEESFWVFGSYHPPEKALILHTFWSNLTRPVTVVILMEMYGEEWLVTGWRGFVIWEGENHDGEIQDGRIRPNEFP